MLTAEEVRRLDGYHARVAGSLAPPLDPSTLAWRRDRCDRRRLMPRHPSTTYYVSHALKVGKFFCGLVRI